MTAAKSAAKAGSKTKRAAVFVDRDGTLNEMVYDETHGLLDSPRRSNQVRMIRNAGSFLADAKRLGYLAVVVTNQPGIAKGTLSFEDLEAVNRTLSQLLEAEGASWDGFFFCPHHPKGSEDGRPEYITECACRKPAPGLLLDAAKELGIDLASSWMVGDGLNDIEAGKAAGCRTILVSKLKMDQVERFFGTANIEPDFIAKDLAKALDIIKKNAKEGS